MKRTLIKNISEGKVKISGFVENLRNKSTMQFIVIRDVSGKVQVTVEKASLPDIASIIDKVSIESVLTVEGIAVKNDFVKLGGIEIIPTKVTIDSIADLLPIEKDSSIDLRLDYRWIDLRDEKKLFIFKVQTAFEKYATQWFADNGYIAIHTPKISAISSEGGSEVFEIKEYFGQKVYLTQSPQLYKQMSMMAGFDKTYEIGECFRAESSFTARHATEFTAIDVELSHIENHHEVMDAEEELLGYVLTKLNEEFGDIVAVPKCKFPRINLNEVYEILKKEKNYEVPKIVKGDLDPDGERLICEYVKEKYGVDFVFVTDYPHKARAFYTMGDNCFDLLYKGVEITSGAQREHRHVELKKNIEEKGINPDNMKEYLEFFKYGSPTHGGYALGIARFMAKLLDLSSIKESTYIFRGPTRLKP